MLGKIHSRLMSKGFPTQTIQKSKMSQEEEEGEGGNEVLLGLPCGRQKAKLMEKANAPSWFSPLVSSAFPLS